MILFLLIRNGWFCVSCFLVFFFGVWLAGWFATSAFEKDPMGKAVFGAFFHLNGGAIFGLAGIFLTAVFAGALISWAATGQAILPFDAPVGGAPSMRDLLILAISAVFAVGFTGASLSMVREGFAGKTRAERFVRERLRVRRLRWSRKLGNFGASIAAYLFIGFLILNFSDWAFTLHPLIIAAAGTAILLMAVLNILTWLWIYSGLWLPTLVLVARLGH